MVDEADDVVAAVDELVELSELEEDAKHGVDDEDTMGALDGRGIELAEEVVGAAVDGAIFPVPIPNIALSNSRKNSKKTFKNPSCRSCLALIAGLLHGDDEIVADKEEELELHELFEGQGPSIAGEGTVCACCDND